jgi:hypothetical protein
MRFPRLNLVALDCPDHTELAKFYSALTGTSVETGSDYAPDVDLEHVFLPTLSFQKVENYAAPTWPGSNVNKQMHLDFEVDDLDERERLVPSIGARKAQYEPGDTYRVFPDPVDHPFRLTITSAQVSHSTELMHRSGDTYCEIRGGISEELAMSN